MYEYSAKVVSVHDGDTVTLDVDLGFGIVRRDKFRLYGPDPTGKMGLDAPELNTLEGKVAQQYLASLLYDAAGRIVIRTVKDRQEKFGRYLVVILISQPAGLPVNVNQLLVTVGNAVLKAY